MFCRRDWVEAVPLVLSKTETNRDRSTMRKSRNPSEWEVPCRRKTACSSDRSVRDDNWFFGSSDCETPWCGGSRGRVQKGSARSCQRSQYDVRRRPQETRRRYPPDRVTES